MREKRITTVTAIPVLLVTLCPNAGSGSAPRSHRTTLRPGMARVSAVIVGVDLRRARWLTLLQTLRGKYPPDRSLSAAPRAGHLGAPALSGHRRNYRQRCADLWCRYRRPSICRDSWLTRIIAGSREGGTSRARTLIFGARRRMSQKSCPGYGMASCPTSPAFGTSERHCRWQQALLVTAAAGSQSYDCTIKPRPSLVAQYQLTNLDE